MEVAVENDRAAREGSGKSAGKATQKHILTCNTNTQSVLNVDAVKRCPGLWTATCCTGGLTRQVEVLQRGLRSHCRAEFRAESGEAVIRSVNLTFGGSDVVCVCDGGSGINVLDLHEHKNTSDFRFPYQRPHLLGDSNTAARMKGFRLKLNDNKL